MMEAYRQLSEVTDYPCMWVLPGWDLSDGPFESGMGIGGDAAGGHRRHHPVSLAAEPEKEVEAGFNILRAVSFPVAGPEVITCPTCGRTQYPAPRSPTRWRKAASWLQKSIKGGGDGLWSMAR